jgi:hypothetical protein
MCLLALDQGYSFGTVGPDLEIILRRAADENLQIAGVIFRARKNGLPVIAPLRDVMGTTDRYRPRNSWHESGLWTKEHGISKK